MEKVDKNTIGIKVKLMYKIDRENVEDIFALTPMQAGMLFHYLSKPGSGVYFDQHCYYLKGVIETDCLKKAWNYVARNNEMLRTIFRWNGLKKPIQIVLKNYQIPFDEYDYSMFNAQEQQKCMEELLYLDQRKAVDIANEPYRVIFCKLSDHEYNMIVSAHHIIYDGWSNALIFKELSYAYREYVNGREPKEGRKTKYKELVHWYETRDKQKQKMFWESYLKGYKAKRFLETGSEYIKHHKVSKYMCQLDEELAEAINQFLLQEQLTLATFVYTIWGIVLHIYSGHEDIIFGVTMSGRMTDIVGVDAIVGLFVNSLPLRINVVQERKIGDILREVNDTIITFEEYQGTPLVDLKQYSLAGTENQLFDSIVVVQNYPLDEKIMDDGQEMSIQFVSSYNLTNFGFSLDVRTFRGIQLVFNYNGEKFDPLKVEKICNSFLKITEMLIHNQKQDFKVKDVDILGTNDWHKEIRNIQNTIDQLSELEGVEFDEIF